MDLNGEIRLGIMNAIRNGKPYETDVKQEDYPVANRAAYEAINELKPGKYTIIFCRTGDGGYVLRVTNAKDD